MTPDGRTITRFSLGNRHVCMVVACTHETGRTAVLSAIWSETPGATASSDLEVLHLNQFDTFPIM